MTSFSSLHITVKVHSSDSDIRVKVIFVKHLIFCVHQFRVRCQKGISVKLLRTVRAQFCYRLNVLPVSRVEVLKYYYENNSVTVQATVSSEIQSSRTKSDKMK